MEKKREIEDPTSCLNRSADDEPLFVLCARDLLAEQAVRTWAEMYSVCHMIAGTLTAQRRAKVEEAKKLAKQMQQWRASHVR